MNFFKGHLQEKGHKAWTTIRISEEFVLFLEKNIISSKNRKIEGIIDHALQDFDKKGSYKISFREDLHLIFQENQPCIFDPKLSDLIKLHRLENGRLHCSYHDFAYTECPHTIWASLNPDVAKWIKQIYNDIPLEPYSKTKSVSKFTRIRKLYRDRIEKKSKFQRLALNCSVQDIIIDKVLNYY